MLTFLHLVLETALYKKLPYDTIRDFAPISLTTKQPFLLGITANVPAKNLRDFIQLVKSKPGEMSYGSSGNGSGTHVSMEMLKQRIGIDILHVPYRGFGIMVNDLISGQVQACIVGVSALMPHIRNGKVRGLAISHNKRLSITADIPTFAEAGVADFEVYQWQGLMASAHVAPQTITKVSDDVARVIRTSEIRERMDKDGLEVIASRPKEFTTFIQTEIERWHKVIKQANIRID
jgi:tripartite-type tricarboxylate transporter receptor subunit TctC